MENLKDLLEDELEGPVKDLSCSLREEGGRVVGESAWGYIERLADQVDSILAKAWAVTLDQVGEEVTVGSPPPRRRLNQKGHIRRAIGVHPPADPPEGGAVRGECGRTGDRPGAGGSRNPQRPAER
eukprot:464578-Prorocentrum_minimum.AAC.1